MTDVNAPNGSLVWRAVNKDITGNGSTSVGAMIKNVDVSFENKQAAIGSSARDYLGLYKWQNYKNEQTELVELTATGTVGEHIFTNRDNTSVVGKLNAASTTAYFYNTTDGWATQTKIGFGSENAYSLGGNGTKIGVGSDGRSVRCISFNGATLDYGNTVNDLDFGTYITGTAISDDGTAFIGTTSDNKLRTYDLSGNTIGSLRATKTISSYGNDIGEYFLTSDGQQVFGIRTVDTLGYANTNDTLFYASIHQDGELYSNNFKASDVYPSGKSYAIPMIAFVDNLDFVRFIYPSDSGTAPDFSTMNYHAKIALSSLPTGAVWAMPISFTEMIVGINGGGGVFHCTKMEYTPLTEGFPI